MPTPNSNFFLARKTPIKARTHKLKQKQKQKFSLLNSFPKRLGTIKICENYEVSWKIKESSLGWSKLPAWSFRRGDRMVTSSLGEWLERGRAQFLPLQATRCFKVSWRYERSSGVRDDSLFWVSKGSGEKNFFIGLPLLVSDTSFGRFLKDFLSKKISSKGLF